MNEEINVHLEMINYLTAMFNVATGAFISSLKSDEIIVGNMRVFIHDSKIADEVSENKDIAYAVETVESAEKAFNYMKESYSSAEDSLELHRVETLARINNVIGDLKENIDSKKKEIVRINSFQEDLLKSSHEISLNHNILKDEMKTHPPTILLCKMLEVGVSARASYWIQHKQTITVLPTAHSLYGCSSYLLNTIFS